ncbi:MAG TPA: hypothetical protein VFP59_00080 [Candidatus Angelobacter sp.]|nr:hypothetical protein [Candidatus Angelobacter sp.]
MEPEKESSSRAQKLRWLLGLLGILGFFWLRSQSKPPLKQSKGSANPNTDTTQKDDGHNLFPAFTPKVPPSPSDTENACECCNHKVPRWKKTLDILLVAFTGGAFATAGIYAYITSKMWKDMHKQTVTAQQQLEQSQRPWIKIVEVKTRGNNPLLPALSFQGFGHGFFPNGNKQATFQVYVAVTNIGHSVADISVDYELFSPLWDSNKYADWVRAEQIRFNAQSLKNAKFQTKQIVFPAEPLEWSGAAVLAFDPRYLAIVHSQITHLPDSPRIDYILPVVIVCVNYRLPGSERIYQSSAVYEVFHSETRTRFFVVGKDMLANRLLVMRNPSLDQAY